MFHAGIVAEHWELLGHEMGDGFWNLLPRIAPDKIARRLLEGEFTSDQSHLYERLLDAGADRVDDFVRWLATGLANVQVEEWKQEAQDGGELVQLLIGLKKRDKHPRLSIAYQDAIVYASEAVAAGDYDPRPHADVWPDLLDLVQNQKALSARIRDAAVEAGADLPDVFFDVFGDRIGDRNILKDDQTVVRKLFTPLVTNRHRRGLQWLGALFSGDPKFLDAFREYEVKDFKERLQLALDTQDEASAELEAVATACGVELPTVTREPEGERADLDEGQ